MYILKLAYYISHIISALQTTLFVIVPIYDKTSPIINVVMPRLVFMYFTQVVVSRKLIKHSSERNKKIKIKKAVQNLKRSL